MNARLTPDPHYVLEALLDAYQTNPFGWTPSMLDPVLVELDLHRRYVALADLIDLGLLNRTALVNPEGARFFCYDLVLDRLDEAEQLVAARYTTGPTVRGRLSVLAV
jgi:hypothetical protein